MCSFFHTDSQKLANTVAHAVSQEDPHQTVQAFIDLVKRHEQTFYHFIYKVHSRGGTLFDDLMKWIQLFLTIVRDGIGNQTSVEFLLPHIGPEREAIMKEIDQVALYHYKLKLAREDKLRRRFGRAQKQDDADAEDEAATALVHGVVNDISFGDLIDGEAEDLAAEESGTDDSSDYSTSDEYDSDEESDDDSGDSEGSNMTDKPPPPPPKPSRPERIGGADGIGYSPNHVGPSPRTRATTMKAPRSDATASTASLDMGKGNKGRLSVTQRLRNSKSMEMLRKGKPLDLPPLPPIPHQYQPYRSKRGTVTTDTGPSPLPQSSSGPLRPSPPTKRPPSLQEATVATTTSENRSNPVSNPTATANSRNSIIFTTTTDEGSTSTWNSKTSLESDKNKPLPDPNTKVGPDPDAPQRDLGATPKAGQKKLKLKKINEQINPPELTHVPKLLPIFVELVRYLCSRVFGPC